MCRLKTDEWMERHFGIACHAGDVADAVLELFEQIDTEQLSVSAGVVWPTGTEPATHTRLVLRTLPEEQL
jgi:hypothetical protein